MFAAEARVNSENASRYLVQLCKHFAHKRPAEYDEAQGRITFEPGRCLLTATADELVITCEAQSAADLAIVKSVVQDHIVRFGWRESLAISWTD